VLIGDIQEKQVTPHYGALSARARSLLCENSSRKRLIGPFLRRMPVRLRKGENDGAAGIMPSPFGHTALY
jgi:hypothetical protein